MLAARATMSRPAAHSLRAAQPCHAPRRAAAPPRAAAAGSQQATVPVTFNLQHKIHFGQEVLLVGSHTALGAWQLEQAVPATWSEGDVWSASVELPAGAQLEFKFVVADPSGAPQWEAGENRCLAVDATAAVLSGSWGQALVPVGVAVSYDADDEEEQAAVLAAPAKRQEAAPAVVPVTAVPAAAAVAEAKQAAAAAAAEAEAKWAAAAAAAAEAEDEAKRAARSGVVLGAAPPRKQEIKLSPQAEAAVGGLIEQAERVAANLAAATARELAKATAPAANVAAPAVEEAAKAVAATPKAKAGAAPKRRAASKPKRGTAAKAKAASDKQ